MPANSHDVDTLNGLLTTVVDSIDGFAQAASVSETARFNAIFRQVAEDRRSLKGDLETEIVRLGGTPEEEGTILASAHRVLMKLRDAVSGGDVAVVDEAERGEDYIKAKFEKAAQDDALAPATRSFVEAAAARVRQGHDRIRDLKHALHADA